MKKLLTLLIISTGLAFSLSAQAMTAKVISITGKVEVLKGESWKALAEGETLSRGDIISTGFNSQAVLSIKESVVTLGALTRMTVEKLAENEVKEQTSLFIDTGKLTANVKHSENKRMDFKIRSPVSTASVRGTIPTIYAATGLVESDEGMVATTKSTSTTAEVAPDDTVTASLPLKRATSIFSSTASVSGESGGVPVYEGQSTETDEFSGRVVSTQVSMVTNNTSVGGYTAATGDSVSENGLAALSAATGTTTSDSGKDQAQTANLNISISFPKSGQ